MITCILGRTASTWLTLTAVTVGPNWPPSVRPGRKNKLPKLCFLNFFPRVSPAKGHRINLVNFLPHCRTVNKGQAAVGSIYHLCSLGAADRVEACALSGGPQAGVDCQGRSLAVLTRPCAADGGPAVCSVWCSVHPESTERLQWIAARCLCWDFKPHMCWI